VPKPGQPYSGGSVGLDDTMGTFSHNLWFGGTGDVSFDATALTVDPKFVAATAHEFHLQSASPAINAGDAAVAAVVTTDYDAVVPRTVGAGIDIGAFEYDAGYVYDRIFADGFQ
jgi:hypothetical protein